MVDRWPSLVCLIWIGHLDIEECEHYDLFLFTMGEEPVKDLYSLSVYTFNLCD